MPLPHESPMLYVVPCVGAVEAAPARCTIITSYVAFFVHARSIRVLPSAVAVATEGSGMFVRTITACTTCGLFVAASLPAPVLVTVFVP